MTRIPPVDPDGLPAAERQAVADAEALMGFVANDVLTMARHPAMMHAFADLVNAIYQSGNIDAGLMRMIGLVTSSAAGCRYCMGHTALSSSALGVANDKLADIWQFETSERFDNAERAALRVALHAGQSPNGVTDEMFATLGDYYDVPAQLDIVAVISLFGFLNRWNATLATELESLPAESLAIAESKSPG